MGELYLVDSHVHFWDPTRLDYPWLGALPALNRPFLPAEFATASANSNVGKLVFIEAGSKPGQNMAEVDWVSGLARKEPRIKGIVAHAALEKGKGAYRELAALAIRPLVKGVRRSLQGEQDPDFCIRPEFVAGVKLLGEFGFTFDVCIRHDQLRGVAELARRVPEVSFVLDHLGKPDVRGRKTKPWAVEVKELATLPNVVCKISGLTTEADWQKWQPADLQFYIEHALEVFGFDRVMFGGDWPVATLATNYERWVDVVRNLIPSGDNRAHPGTTTDSLSPPERGEGWGEGDCTRKPRTSSPRPSGFPSPPQVSFPTGDVRSAQRGPPFGEERGKMVVTSRDDLARAKLFQANAERIYRV